MLLAPRWFRNWCVLVALFAIMGSLALTTIALTPLHGHGRQRTCELCNTVHLPSLQAVREVSFAAPGLVVCQTIQEPTQRILDLHFGSADSRAPPLES